MGNHDNGDVDTLDEDGVETEKVTFGDHVKVLSEDELEKVNGADGE